MIANHVKLLAQAAGVRALWTVGAFGGAGAGAVAASSYRESRAGDGRRVRFLGLSRIEPASRQLHPVLEVDEHPLRELLGEMVPSTFAWNAADQTMLLAPPSVQWVRTWLSEPASAEPIGSGRERAEVRGLVTLPPDWYRPGRARIDQWLAARRTSL